ncbi:hypothetical protein [Rhizorhapis sp. SPR117]|uniref:hypothetical protein n=1 Tax=Rhizorhapis sp. SPR117 TaxID=2912611 RepID=UPI001F3BB2BA|nr:hypothetical protein [Rhizorhapis sp. SPR117]
MSCSVQILAAKSALARAAWARGVAPYYDDDAITDLLVDIRHWCREAGIDYAASEQLASRIYLNEAGSAS